MDDDIRIKDLPLAEDGIQTDDYLPVDGATDGTRKITMQNIVEANVSGLETEATNTKGAINELFNKASRTVSLTQAEYDALPASKLSDDIAYYITDGEPDVDNTLWAKVGRATLDTQAQNCSEAINELNTAVETDEADISEIKQSLSDIGDATLLHTFTAIDSTGVSVDFTPYRTVLVVVYDGTWGYMASSYYPIDLFLTAENHWARSQWGNSVVSGGVRYVNNKLQCLYLESGGLSAVVCRVYGLK